MNKMYKLLVVILMSPILVIAQSRNDAGLRGDAGAVSGFFEALNPVNFPVGAKEWWHLLDIRHSNTTNNYAMQFSGSFFDQILYFRKTINNPSAAWSKVILETDGKVGIGTNSPQSALHVVGKTKLENNLKIFGVDEAWAEGVLVVKPTGWGGFRIARNDPASGNYDGNWAIGYAGGTGNDLSITNGSNVSQGNFVFHISALTGNIGIATSNPTERLSVNGNIRAKELKIEAKNWPDYVFSKDYKLSNLQVVEKHINKEGYLPDMPSAKDVEQNGINVSEMNAKLLKKIEELTLYVIELNKKSSSQEEKVENLQKEVRMLKQKNKRRNKRSRR